MVSARSCLQDARCHLPKVGAGLDLDDDQRDHAGVLEPVHGAEGNVGGLVFMVQEHLVANGDLGRPFHHHPVLCPVVVLLERKLPPGLTMMRFT